MSVVSVTELIEAVTVIPDPSGTPFKENLTEIGGNAIDTGVGAAGSGTQRVALATDSQVIPYNITGKFRESFETFTPGVFWNLTQDPNDIVLLDGNAVSAAYIVISKDPLTVGGVTTLETIDTFKFPFEAAVGLSMSQRTLGQELSVEFVDTLTPLEPVADVAIASIQQTTTTLTVTTTGAHGLVPGKRIGIYGVADSRLNYPCLVVATINSTTQFTCTAGPNGTIPSVTTGPFTNQGYVYFRPSLGYAQNGISQIFENGTTNNSSMYSRTGGGDSLPSGTVNTNQTVTVGSTLGTQAINSPYTYAFLPGSEYRFILQADRVQWMDVTVDSSSGMNNRLLRTQVVPDPNLEYKLRFRFTNDAGLTVPTAKIVSAAKSGSTTATIVTDVAHGLTTNDYIVIYGIRDTTNFAAQTTIVPVASVVNSTTFTVVFGASATATSYGGMVSRVQGSNIPTAFNMGTNGSIQSVEGINGELQIIATNSYSFLVGDYVNLYGCRGSAGQDLGLDGTYKVVFVSTNNTRLIPIGNTPAVATFSIISAGGLIIRRTDLRLAFVRIFDYERQRVEIQPNAATAASVPVQLTSGTVSSVSSVALANLATNLLVADITSAAITSTTTSGTITPSASALSHEFNVIVTAVSGTNPTLDVVVQESDDSGTNWYDIYQFPRITATGQYRSPLIPLTGNRIRYVRTVGGTSPSFTMSLNRQQSQTSNPIQRQFFSYVLPVNTLNSVTSSIFTEGCVDINVVVSMGAVTTTAPVLVYEASADGSNWAQIGADITTAANTVNVLQLSNTQARFSRIRVKTAGSGASLGSVMVKGVGK